MSASAVIQHRAPTRAEVSEKGSGLQVVLLLRLDPRATEEEVILMRLGTKLKYLTLLLQ